MCLPIPAAGKTNISLPGNPKQSHTHTSALCLPSPSPGGRQEELCAPGSPQGPPAWTRSLIPILAPGHGAPNPNAWRGKGPAAKGRPRGWGTRDRRPPRPGDIPRAALLRVARTDIVLLSLSPRRTLGMFNELQALGKTPSDGRNPPKPAITQLRRIWVTAVSHGHPESDSTLLEGPDPAADFPGRGSKTLRKGRMDGHHLQIPRQPTAGRSPGRSGVKAHPSPCTSALPSRARSFPPGFGRNSSTPSCQARWRSRETRPCPH